MCPLTHGHLLTLAEVGKIAATQPEKHPVKKVVPCSGRAESSALLPVWFLHSQAGPHLDSLRRNEGHEKCMWEAPHRRGSCCWGTSRPKCLLGTFLHSRRDTWSGPAACCSPVQGTEKGIGMATCFPHRNPAASDPSATREELEQRAIVTPALPPQTALVQALDCGKDLGQCAEAEAETQGAGEQEIGLPPGPGGGVQLRSGGGPRYSIQRTFGHPWMVVGGKLSGLKRQPGPLSCRLGSLSPRLPGPRP